MNIDKMPFKDITLKMNFDNLATRYKTELLDNVVPFWSSHSPDKQFGGYLTCLDRKGNAYDTDKFVWLQARQVWLFAMLYNEVETKKEWLDIALHGAEFLMKHGHDGSFNWYFSLTREGKPLVQPYNIFSNTFAAMAFAQLGKATGHEPFHLIATKTFERVIERKDNPKGRYNKVYPGTRPLKNFSLPMILSNLCLEMEHLLAPEVVEDLIEEAISQIMGDFKDKDSGLILENVLADGGFSDSFEGRLLNPGHALEAMWFIMDLSVRRIQPSLTKEAIDVTLRTLEKSWDTTYGGIFYFMDIKGHPPQQLEWDQKLWWVHLETMITLLKGYELTGNETCLHWFKKVESWTWDRFKDPEYPEWYGYLNRRGEVLLPLKGGKWKGCFHVPRALFQCWKTAERIAQRNTVKSETS